MQDRDAPLIMRQKSMSEVVLENIMPGLPGENVMDHIRMLPSEALRSCELPYRVEDGVAIISLGDGDQSLRQWGTVECEHRLDASAVLALSAALDKAESDLEVEALVLHADGKYFCNGFDLKFFQAFPQGMNIVQAGTELLLARLLAFPVPTVAALNGHATAAGAMLALALDFRFMDKDRGYMFVPGIDLGLTYSNGMSRLMESKLPQVLHRDFIVYGERFNAPALQTHGVVDAAVANSEVLATALERARAKKPKAKHRETMCRIKTTMYQEAVAALKLESCNFSPMGFDNIAKGQDRPGAPETRPVRPRTMTLQESKEALVVQGRNKAFEDLEKLTRQPTSASHSASASATGTPAENGAKTW